MIYFLLVFQQFLASTTHIVAQDAIHNYDPLIVLFYRSTIASLALVTILAIQYRTVMVFANIQKKDWIAFLIIGALNVPINQLLFLEGLRFTTAANSALLYALTPAMVFMITRVAHRERFTLLRLCGIIVAFLGVLLIMFEKGVSFDHENTKGNFLIFLAVIAWSFYSFLGKPLVERYGALRSTALNMLIGTVVFMPFGLAADPRRLFSAPKFIWAEVLYLAIGASVVNYLLWFYALGRLQTSRVAIFQNLQPVMTTAMAILLGRAILTTTFLAGGSMTMIGVLLVQLF